MTKSGLLLGVALGLTVTAAAEEDVESANFEMVGCRSYLNNYGTIP